MKKRFLSIALVLSMLLSLIPITASEASADTTSQETNMSTKSLTNVNGQQTVVDEVNMTIENFGSYTNQYGTYNLDWYIVGYVDTVNHTIETGSQVCTTTNTIEDADGNTVANRSNIALIQCKNSIDPVQFQNDYDFATWKGSYIQYYLNDGEYLLNDNNFTEEEQSILISTDLKTISDYNSGEEIEYTKKATGKYSTEKFFVLPIADINNYVSDFANDKYNPVNISTERKYISNGTSVTEGSPTYREVTRWDEEKQMRVLDHYECYGSWSASYEVYKTDYYYTLNSCQNTSCVAAYDGLVSKAVELKAANATVVPAAFIDMSKLRQYTITYDLNGGTGTAPTYSGTAMIGDTITLPSSDGFSRVGYTFKGWSTNKDATSASTGSYTIQYSDNTVVASEGALDYNITYYAVWEKNYYPIVYDLNGGTGTVPTTSKTYGLGDKIYELDYGEGLKKSGRRNIYHY